MANNHTAIDFQRFYDAMTQNKIKKIIYKMQKVTESANKRMCHSVMG